MGLYAVSVFYAVLSFYTVLGLYAVSVFYAVLSFYTVLGLYAVSGFFGKLFKGLPTHGIDPPLSPLINFYLEQK